MSEMVLVLGATGSFGGGVAAELMRRGLRLRVLARSPEKAAAALACVAGADTGALEVVAGDVQDRALVAEAAAGCAVIVHGINYPYDQWLPHMETASDNVVAAAKAAGAAILFPGNVYGLGAQTEGALDEAAPNRPCSRKGELRVRLEDDLRRASNDGVQVLIVRAGDYFGPSVRNGLVDPLFGNAAAGKRMQALGNLEIAHEWVYLPDLARVAVELIERRASLARFEIVHLAGHVAETNRAFLEAVAREAGHPGLKIFNPPWLLLRALGLFDGVVRELIEMRYLFDGAVVLDGARLGALLPDYAATPLDEAIRATLESYRASSTSNP